MSGFFEGLKAQKQIELFWCVLVLSILYFATDATDKQHFLKSPIEKVTRKSFKKCQKCVASVADCLEGYHPPW
jgi:hypothetical protein